MIKHVLIVAFLLITVSAWTQKPSATLVFSKTINGAAETKFSSGDFIYGRIEFSGGTVNDFFGWGTVTDKNAYFSLRTNLWIWYGKEYHQCAPFQALMLKTEERNKTVLNFDILPEPSKASSIILFNESYRTTPTNSTFALSVSKDNFPKEGIYNIKYTVSGNTKDEWGKDKTIDIKGEFDFDFHNSDVAKIIKERDESAKLIKNTAFKLEKMPELFSKNIQVKDPKLTKAKIAAILKRDMPNTKILKFAVSEHKTVWEVMKNDLGIPRYRYFVGDIYYIHKVGDNCKVDAVYLREDYLGGGKYGTLKVGGGSGGQTQLINCSAVK
jgi:hypothetical protein